MGRNFLKKVFPKTPTSKTFKQTGEQSEVQIQQKICISFVVLSGWEFLEWGKAFFLKQ